MLNTMPVNKIGQGTSGAVAVAELIAVNFSAGTLDRRAWKPSKKLPFPKKIKAKIGTAQPPIAKRMP